MKTLTRGIAPRIISVILVLMLLFSLCSVGMTSAFAADVDLARTGVNIEGGTKLYIKVNDNWLSDSARFAAYYYGDSGEAWTSLTEAEVENVYVVDTPSGTWSNIIFCRMDPSSDENDWGYIWNQTSDLEYDGTNNMYVMEEDEWDWGYSEWSVYTTSVPDVPDVPDNPDKASSVNIMGFGGDWSTGINMTYTSDANVVSATVDLSAGTHEFKIKNGSTWYGNSGTIEDTTTTTSSSGWVMDNDANCKLQASGGTYTFIYTISTNKLVVTYMAESTEETGANTATVYVDIANSSFKSAPYLYVWESENSSTIGSKWPGKLMEGPNSEGYYYRTFKFDESYQFIVNDNDGTQTEDSAIYTEKELYVTFTGGTDYVVGEVPEFWVDLNPVDDTTDLDLLYPELIDGAWHLFLPSGVDATSLEFHYSEGASLEISYIPVSDGGTINLSGGVNSTGTAGYVLGGSFSGNLKIKQSANVATVYTNTDEAVPQGTGYGDHKDDYSSNGTIMVTNSDGTMRLSEATLKKLKGRGNSTWEASNEIIGKYAFNITLGEETGLIDSESVTDKYCLVSFNSDEARMRNMLIYDLAKNIGIEFVANFEPVDLYNNGYYIGSYLLVEKNEIGDPLVDILDLDDINENASSSNKVLYDDESKMVFTASNGDLTTTTGAGFYKYVSNLEEPDPSTYAQSGFLLEFELNERFAEEPSGFISDKGQQIIVQGPEFATKNEIEFIMDKWNEAEALMYDEDATYEQLNAVIDVESFAKMYLIQELSKNLDAGATSYFVYYDGGKLHAGVTWDYDWTLGQYIQSGDSNLSVDNQTSGKFDSEANKLLNNPEGWWANSKEIYPNTGTLNAQAALCQNENFWNVVKAEWNEVFYDEAILYADSTVSSVNALDGKMRELYYAVHSATLMDEAKWGIIADDPLTSWGSEDTGDTHDMATVYLNDYFYNRLKWMDTKLASDTYTLVTPELESSVKSCSKGDTITLTATTNSSGTLKYNFYYPDGTLITTVTSSTGVATCDVKAADKGDATYSVKVTSDNTTALSDPGYVTVNVKSTALDIQLEAPESVIIGSEIIIKAIPNTDEAVTYTLLDAAGITLGTNTTGEFTYTTTAGDDGKTLTFMVTAESEVDGETFTVTKSVDVKVTPIVFGVELTAERTTVEFGTDISLTANASSPAEITYYFYNADTDKLIATNTTGTMDEATTAEDIGTVRTYYVRAVTTVLGMVYEAYSDDIAVSITEIKEVYNVNIYFKSTSTYGYAPVMTTKGALEDITDKAMEKDIFICKNATETASYFWYKATVAVPKSSGKLTVGVLSSRYAMEAETTLEITADGDIYLAVDDLNHGDTIVNLTDVSEDQRNWCQSAVHMVYDPKYDSEQSLAEVTARVDLRFVGDTNGDDKINIKDATYIQKALVQLVILDNTSAEVADVDCDGRVTIKDATAIQKKLVALP